jgi:hypothetical protein
MRSLFARLVLFFIKPALTLHAERTGANKLHADVTWLRSVEAARKERADREAAKAALQRNRQSK